MVARCLEWRPASRVLADVSAIQGYLFLLGALSAVFFCSLQMPHRRSPDALAARRLRASQRGYVSPVPSGCKHMAVPIELADRARAQVAGLAAHATCNKFCQQPRHFAAQAILEAREHLPPERFSRFMKVNRAAARARHVWADAPPPAKRVRWADCEDGLPNVDAPSLAPIVDEPAIEWVRKPCAATQTTGLLPSPDLGYEKLQSQFDALHEMVMGLKNSFLSLVNDLVSRSLGSMAESLSNAVSAQMSSHAEILATTFASQLEALANAIRAKHDSLASAANVLVHDSSQEYFDGLFASLTDPVCAPGLLAAFSGADSSFVIPALSGAPDRGLADPVGERCGPSTPSANSSDVSDEEFDAELTRGARLRPCRVIAASRP